MLTVDLRNDPRWLEPTLRAELDRIECAVLSTAPDVGRPLALPWIEDPLLVLDGRTPWLCTPVHRCPQAAGDGRSVVPRSQLRRLRQLARRDLPFQGLTIAHELDRTGPVHHLIPRLAGGPSSCSDGEARLLAGPLPAHPGLSAAVNALARITGAAASGAARARELVTDPILFGTVPAGRAEPGAPSLWFPLIVWAW